MDLDLILKVSSKSESVETHLYIQLLKNTSNVKLQTTLIIS